ncbi:MAG: DEAD/DEAH box helicase family protein [Synergistaceae bacterium]|nr:DEAD/DEAH box helicase family protein [Synergistaceae bacterium]
MRLKFALQDFQTRAVESVTEIFAGQGYNAANITGQAVGDIFYTGYANGKIFLSDSQLLHNIRRIQTQNNIKLSDSLNKDFGACVLDIEMETGTGKTYTYIKTIFELNKIYGWSKFIVIVPSIAIREGVRKSFEITESHFMEIYGKKARTFVYDSDNLHEIDEFSSDSRINVMIINIQAFNASEAGKNTKSARIINSERDDFGSRRPIDVIAENRPVIILDEPQKMGGAKTLAGIKKFNPLFCLNYSATHKQHHNLIYVLDAYEAYKQKLVKKIEVTCFDVKNLPGSYNYMYLSDIIISPSSAPKARLEFEKNGKRITRIISAGDDLFALSGEMNQYSGFRVSDIDPTQNIMTFTNGKIIHVGEAIGDISESYLRRLQIRETIRAHLEKEKILFERGIKCLSLFFIDEVAKYRGENAEYAEIFESEYNLLVKEYINDGTLYSKYLQGIDAKRTHAGYFAIDKKGRKIQDESSNVSDYDLILRDKERLLSLTEPVRFIFSHSALREGWDNPNIFQICTLKHGGESYIAKRQEVGRGLRLCVNQDGSRESDYDLNKLTVIASEGYKDFVSGLQKGIIEDLYNRPVKADIEYFKGKKFIYDGQEFIISEHQARKIHNYLLKNDYIDLDDNITQKYHDDREKNNFAPLPDGINDGVHTVIQAIFDVNSMIQDGRAAKVEGNPLNKNFYREEFQRLWSLINHKYVYRAEFDSEELITKSIASINKNLSVSQVTITITTGTQGDLTEFDTAKTHTEQMNISRHSSVKYDFLGDIARGTNLTRRTAAKILSGIEREKFSMFTQNPEEFIKKIITLINEQRAAIIIEQVTYSRTDNIHDIAIFTEQKFSESPRACRTRKNVQTFIFPDSKVEQDMTKDLDVSEEVSVYAKLPRGFKIPTPMGNYSPDWAIVFNEGEKREIYFIAETKGDLSSLQLKPIESAKIECAKKLFDSLSSQGVIYHEVTQYSDLLRLIHEDK